MVSGMMKCRSEKPCPCAWLTALIGAPSMKNARSVPWSRSNPRMKYCWALPPPACCTVKRPGTASSTFSVRRRGRRPSSAWPVVESDAAMLSGSRFEAPYVRLPMTVTVWGGACGGGWGWGACVSASAAWTGGTAGAADAGRGASVGGAGWSPASASGAGAGTVTPASSASAVRRRGERSASAARRHERDQDGGEE